MTIGTYLPLVFIEGKGPPFAGLELGLARSQSIGTILSSYQWVSDTGGTIRQRRIETLLKQYPNTLRDTQIGSHQRLQQPEVGGFPCIHEGTSSALQLAEVSGDGVGKACQGRSSDCSFMEQVGNTNCGGAKTWLICGDFKVKVNPRQKVDWYLLPHIEDIQHNRSAFGVPTDGIRGGLQNTCYH